MSEKASYEVSRRIKTRSSEVTYAKAGRIAKRLKRRPFDVAQIALDERVFQKTAKLYDPYSTDKSISERANTLAYLAGQVGKSGKYNYKKAPNLKLPSQAAAKDYIEKYEKVYDQTRVDDDPDLLTRLQEETDLLAATR